MNDVICSVRGSHNITATAQEAPANNDEIFNSIITVRDVASSAQNQATLA